VHRHDGFFLRFGFGLGYGSLDGDADASPNEGVLRGGMFSPEILLGGTPATGLVIGSGLVLHSMPNASGERNGEPSTSEGDRYNMVTLPLFANYYFDPTRGWQIQGVLGLANGEPRLGGVTSSDTPGIVLAVGGGWEQWVGEQWSIGVFARLTYTRLRYKNDTRGAVGGIEETYNFWAPTISFIATLH
jgi:hypothetical protein